MTITYEKHYKDYPILTDKDKKLGCDTDILDKNLSVLNHTTQKHNKVLAFRMDINFPTNYHPDPSNKDINTFMSRFIKYGKRKKLDPHYVLVREQSKEKHQHYHCMMFCDGNKIKHPQKLLEQAEKNWGTIIGQDAKGLINHCRRSRDGEPQPNSYMMRRDDDNYDQVKKDCFQRCSYLAKANTKGYAPHRVREVTTSRIPK